MRHRLLTACRPSSTDAQLARRAAAGDDDAFEKLYARYQPRLEAYCRSIVRHDEDARDAVQNAMTKALVALRRADNTTNVQGWLFRIAHNEAITLLRRRRPTAELHDVMHDRRLDPAGELLLREELRATLDSVRALPGNLQHPLLLRELAGLSYLQVAEVVGGTPAAARKAVFDARTALSTDRAGRDEACAVIRQSLSEGDGRRRRARLVRSHLQSCNACCAWESEQRLRRHNLAALLPAAGVAGSAGSWFAGLFGGGSTVAAGVSGSLATSAKVAASLAVIAAGATPVVEHVEHAVSKPVAKVVANARAVAAIRASRRASVSWSAVTSAVASSSSVGVAGSRPGSMSVRPTPGNAFGSGSGSAKPSGSGSESGAGSGPAMPALIAGTTAPGEAATGSASSGEASGTTWPASNLAGSGSSATTSGTPTSTTASGDAR